MWALRGSFTCRLARVSGYCGVAAETAMPAGRRHPAQDAPTGHALGVLQLKAGASLEAVGPCRAGGGYNREMNEKRGASGPEQSVPDQVEIELFEGFRAAGLKEERAMRTVQAVRVQAGHSIKETLEVHQAKVATRVDGVEKDLTAKIDGVRTDLTAKIDGVETRLTAKIDGVEKDLTAKIDGVETRLTAKIDGVETRLTAKIDGVETRLTAEMKAIKRELAFFRWLLIILIAFLSLLVASGLIPKFDRWPWQDATPEQSTSTPVASDPPQIGVPSEPDPPDPAPE